MKINHKSDYAARRRAEYPSIADQLDALWKLIDATTGAANIPADSATVLNAIKAVKQKYPKGKGDK